MIIEILITTLLAKFL